MSDEKVIVTKSKLDSLATSISNKSGVAVPLTIAQMKTAVDSISTGGGGTITIEEIPNATGTTLQITTNGSGGSSGGGGQTAFGTVTGSGTGVLQIPCSFAPDLIYVYGDLSGDATYRGTASVTIIKDEVAYVSADTTTSGTDEFASIIKGITGYNESDTTHIHATYSNGILSIDSANGSSSSGKWRDGQIYNYKLISWT